MKNSRLSKENVMNYYVTSSHTDQCTVHAQLSLKVFAVQSKCKIVVVNEQYKLIKNKIMVHVRKKDAGNCKMLQIENKNCKQLRRTEWNS